MEVELWKNIAGTTYEVSSFGRVRNKKGRILSQMVNRFGYKRLNLYINKVMKNCKVHRLVAEAFVDNPYNSNVVNHIDGDKTNNHSSNLEWVTQKENLRHFHALRHHNNTILSLLCPCCAAKIDTYLKTAAA